jgi:uncharacterized protein YdeI (BOF family)
MRTIVILLLLALAVVALGAAGCGDEVNVQKSYEGDAAPPSQNDGGEQTVYQRSVHVESEGFDEKDADDEDEVKIQRSSETTTETKEMQVTP